MRDRGRNKGRIAKKGTQREEEIEGERRGEEKRGDISIKEGKRKEKK